MKSTPDIARELGIPRQAAVLRIQMYQKTDNIIPHAKLEHSVMKNYWDAEQVRKIKAYIRKHPCSKVGHGS